MINCFNTTLNVIKLWDYIVTSGVNKRKQKDTNYIDEFTISSNIYDETFSAALIRKSINWMSKHKKSSER